MRPIKKLTLPSITDINISESPDLTIWQRAINEKIDGCDSYAEDSRKPGADGTELWDRHIPIEIKGKFRELLFTEQSGYCCYCGKKLKDSSTGVRVEHLNAKSLYPHLTFDYRNLYLSCSGGPTEIIPYYPTKGDTLSSIAKEYEVSVDAVILPDRPKAKPKESILPNEKVTINLWNIPHCDPKKGDNEIKIQPIFKKKRRVFNRHTYKGWDGFSCRGRVFFSSKGEIEIVDPADSSGKLQHPTIITLNLNTAYIKQKRAAVYLTVMNEYAEIQSMCHSFDDIIANMQAKIEGIETQSIEERKDYDFVKICYWIQLILELQMERAARQGQDQNLFLKSAIKTIEDKGKNAEELELVRLLYLKDWR